MWQALKNRTFRKRDNWRGQSYVFFEGRDGSRRCLWQVHGSVPTAISSTLVPVDVISSRRRAKMQRQRSSRSASRSSGSGGAASSAMAAESGFGDMKVRRRSHQAGTPPTDMPEAVRLSGRDYELDPTGTCLVPTTLPESQRFCLSSAIRMRHEECLRKGQPLPLGRAAADAGIPPGVLVLDPAVHGPLVLDRNGRRIPMELVRSDAFKAAAAAFRHLDAFAASSTATSSSLLSSGTTTGQPSSSANSSVGGAPAPGPPPDSLVRVKPPQLAMQAAQALPLPRPQTIPQRPPLPLASSGPPPPPPPPSRRVAQRGFRMEEDLLDDSEVAVTAPVASSAAGDVDDDIWKVLETRHQAVLRRQRIADGVVAPNPRMAPMGVGGGAYPMGAMIPPSTRGNVLMLGVHRPQQQQPALQPILQPHLQPQMRPPPVDPAALPDPSGTLPTVPNDPRMVEYQRQAFAAMQKLVERQEAERRAFLEQFRSQQPQPLPQQMPFVAVPSAPPPPPLPSSRQFGQ